MPTPLSEIERLQFAPPTSYPMTIWAPYGLSGNACFKALILGSSGRRNTLREEVAMAIRKQRSDRSGRGALPSPGRPSVARREDRQLFWAAIAAGCWAGEAAGGAWGLRSPGTPRVRGGGGWPPSPILPSLESLVWGLLSLTGREGDV